MQKCVHEERQRAKELHESYLVITTKRYAMLIHAVEYVLICCQIVCKCVRKKNETNTQRESPYHLQQFFSFDAFSLDRYFPPMSIFINATTENNM